MSTSQNDDDTTPPGSPTEGSASEQPRPQPRYGAYSPSGAGSQTESATGSETAGSYNPYAQPTWGQPGEGSTGGAQQSPGPYGSAPYNAGQPHQHDPYGNPYGTQQQNQQPHQPAWQQQGGYPPQQGYAAPQRPKRPATLWTALAALLTAGATSLIWGVYVFVTLPTQSLTGAFGGAFSEAFIEEMERQSAQDPELQELSSQEIEEVLLVSIGVFALIWAAILLALYIGAAFLGSMAGNPGRIIATIWAALSLLFLTLGHDGASYGIIAATISFSVVAIVMMWLPASGQYIRYRKWEKETMRGGYRG